MKRGNWKLIIIPLISLLILAIFILSVNSTSIRSVYYGPPLADAAYEQVDQFQAQNESSHVIFDVDESWLGVDVIVNSSGAAQIKISAISPEGQTVVTLERNLTINIKEVSAIASFNPANIQGQKVGNWTLTYEIIGGPVSIKLEKVSSFGTPHN